MDKQLNNQLHALRAAITTELLRRDRSLAWLAREAAVGYAALYAAMKLNKIARPTRALREAARALSLDGVSSPPPPGGAVADIESRPCRRGSLKELKQ